MTDLTDDQIKRLLQQADGLTQKISQALCHQHLTHLTVVEQEVKALQLRARVLPEHWRPSVSWVMILELYIANAQGRKMSVKQVGLAANAAQATVHRKLGFMVQKGWVERTPAKHDRRVILLTITNLAEELVNRWASEKIATILAPNSNSAANN